VGTANFEWIVEHVADMAIAKAKTTPKLPELRWAAFLGSEPAPAKAAKKSAKSAAARAKTSTLAKEVEKAAAQQEPMGSVAAATQGG
jgi:hypothetical protein